MQNTINYDEIIKNGNSLKQSYEEIRVQVKEGLNSVSDKVINGGLISNVSTQAILSCMNAVNNAIEVAGDSILELVSLITNVVPSTYQSTEESIKAQFANLSSGTFSDTKLSDTSHLYTSDPSNKNITTNARLKSEYPYARRKDETY